MNRRSRLFVAAVVASFLIALVPVSRVMERQRREKTAIVQRYECLRLALAARDTNALRTLFPEEIRGGVHGSFGLLQNFVKPLSVRSRITLHGDDASVCPEPIRHFRVIPGGHTIVLVRRDGEWFFTGTVNID